MRMWPRRMVWQRNGRSAAEMGAWQESRKLPAEVALRSVGGERHSMPSATSTTHSLHLPLLQAGRGHADAEALGVIEKRQRRVGLDRVSVDGEWLP
jgi:hypothetical protein